LACNEDQKSWENPLDAEGHGALTCVIT